MRKKDETWINNLWSRLPIKTSWLDKVKHYLYTDKRGKKFSGVTSTKQKESKMDSIKTQIKLIPKFIAMTGLVASSAAYLFDRYKDDKVALCMSGILLITAFIVATKQEK